MLRIQTPHALRLLPFLLLACALLAAPGCSTLSGGGDRARLDGPFDPVALRQLGLAPRWINNIAVAGDRVSFGEVFGDTLILLEGDENIVTALDFRTGALRWTRKVGSSLTRLSGANAFGDDLYIASNARLFKLDMDTGESLAFSPLAQPVTAPSVSDGPLVAYGGTNGLAFGVDLRSTAVRWRYSMPGGIVARPVISGSDVFFADAAGTYVALDLATGTLRWRNHIFGGVSATPVVHRGNILVASEDRTLYALDRNDGSEAWTYRADTPLTLAPLSVGQSAYLPVPGGGLVALSADGEVRWQLNQPTLPIAEVPGGILGYADGALIVFNPEDGRTLRRAAALPPSLIVRSDNGLVLILGRRTAVRLDPITR